MHKGNPETKAFVILRALSGSSVFLARAQTDPPAARAGMLISPQSEDTSARHLKFVFSSDLLRFSAAVLRALCDAGRALCPPCALW